ncbi:hypothetical protein EV175_006635, partial [Coemansia sp. RSA 1933]
KTYPDQYVQIEDRVPQLVRLDAVLQFGCFVNPKRMYQHFLDSNTEPCYLDAAYQCDRDGFQTWTLFFEYNITVLVSYLVSTSITVSLVRNWLETLTASLKLLPMSTAIFVNSTELVDELYYIIEESRSLVARPRRRSSGIQWDAQVANAAHNIDIDLYSAMKVGSKPGTALFSLVEHLLDRKEKWLPKADHDLGLFNHSGVAASRWRYPLWMTMLSRPNKMRVDAVVRYLHSQLTQGVEAVVNDQDSGLRTVQYKSMDAMEQGSCLLKKSLADARILPLADSVVCGSDGRELSSKTIVDLKHKVCEHLVFCSSDYMHQPHQLRLMESIPYA